MRNQNEDGALESHELVLFFCTWKLNKLKPISEINTDISEIVNYRFEETTTQPTQADHLKRKKREQLGA